MRSALLLACCALAFPIRAASTPSMRLEREGGGLRLVNTLTHERVALSADAPLFDFGDFQVGGASAGPGIWRASPEGESCEWRLRGVHPAAIRADFAYDARARVLRKRVRLQLNGGWPALLRSVTLDAIDARGQAPQHHGTLQSYPVLCRSFFFGVEFPIATTRVDGDRAILSDAPGCQVAPGTWYAAHPAVYGAAERGHAREAFERYIAAIRARPRGIHFNYNSWWTSPVPYTERDILGIIDQFRRNLWAPYRVAPDTFCIDMGWSDAKSIWRIDPKLFPRGFTALQKACAGIHSRLGLWISPSAVYAQALDLKWAREAGYEADTKACLGGNRYQEAFAKALTDIASRYGLGHVKFDGYVPTCDATDHGHPPGALSAEPIAEGIIAAFERLRRADPGVWMEPTCFGYDPSPWWLMWCNSVIGTYGDDAPNGRVPCPVYRESYTTARDFYNLIGTRDILAPIAAQEVLGIVHQTSEPLQNDAVTAVLRGHQFLPLYVNPRFMTPRRWEFLAALMKWARRNQATLGETRAILPASWRRDPARMSLGAQMPREPYGYGHWHAGRGLLMLRNPWIAPATVRVSPARDLGAPASARGLAVVSIYLERCTLATGLRGDGTLDVALRPYETLVADVAPRRRLLPPKRSPERLPVTRLRAIVTRFEATGDGPAFGPSYTRLVEPGAPHVHVRIAGEVRGPASVRAALLVLVEGSEDLHAPTCRVSVNGRPAGVTVIPSSAGWRATGAPPPEQWVWLSVPLRGGLARIDADVIAAGAGDRVSAWVLTTRDVPWRRLAHVDGTSLPPPEAMALSAVCVLRPVTASSSLPLERGPAPCVRIAGVYLDTLTPISATQGWGTLQRNRSVWEKPLTIDGRGFLRGLGTHAPSRIVYDLSGRWRRFQAWAGADQATSPSVTFEVRVDGRSVWRSGLMTRDTPAKRVDVDVSGARRLELIVGDGGNGIGGDHADWADAVLVR